MRTYLLRAEAGGTLLEYPYLTLTVSANETPDGGFSYAAIPRPGPRVLERLSIDGSRIRVDQIARAWVPPEAELANPTPAFTPKLVFDVLRDGGFAFSDSTGYAVKFAAADGTIVLVMTRPIGARKVTEEMLAKYHQRRVEEAERDFGCGDLPPESRDRMREVMDYDGTLELARSCPVHRGIPII